MAFCSNCGAQLQEGSKFCTNCGTKYETPKPAAASPVAPEPENPVQEPIKAPEAPQQGVYTPPVQQDYAPQGNQQTYTPPAQQDYAPQGNQQTYTPPVQQSDAVQGGAGRPKAQPVFTAPKQKKPMNKKLLFIIGGAVLAVILAIVLICVLGGKGGGGDAADDPNLGLYTATTAEMLGIEMDITDLFENGVTIELKSNGKCIMNVDGTKGSGKWTLENGVFHVKGGGLDCDGTLANGVMTLENMLDMGVAMTFEKEGGFTPANPGPAGTDGLPEGSAGSGAASELQRQWTGTWYGCMYVSEATGEFETVPCDTYNAYMVVDVDAEGKGTFAVYLDSSEMAFALADCEATKGGLNAVDGNVAGMDMYAYNWMFLPMPDYPDQYVMSDEIQTDNGTFSYSLFMKPWDASWQKEIDSDFVIVPPAIDRYNEAVANGELPPVGFAPIGYEGTAEPSGIGGDRPVQGGADPDDQKDPPAESDDFGKTTADADGIVSFDTLKQVFTWLRYQTGYDGGYQRPTYEEIAEKFGVDAHKTHADSWQEDYHVYEWITTDGDFLLLSFKVQADGSENWNSSSWSSSLND